ncbi:MAG: hypothetical protein ABIS50_20920 [Luteolibacter sp.]|uniref:hypothetical protein n=1 Tax=Luteolibacter sp. TaxID=1962973 RepID=UPI003263AC39
MANVFGILTAIALALSAFVAFKNHAAYEKDLADTDTRKGELAKSEIRLADDKKVLTALPIEIDGVDAEVDTLTASEAAQKKVNDGLSKQVDEKTKKIASDKEQLDGIREKTAKVGNIDELAAKMREMNAAIEQLKQSITGNEAKLANLTAQNTSTEAQITDTKGKFDDFAGGRSLASLNTRIRSIYPNWGFVTLAAGNNAGVVNSSTLNVVRNDQVIAKLLVTAVESTTASASIVPDSMAADATLMVGDRVVPGLKETTPSVSAPVVTPPSN